MSPRFDEVRRLADLEKKATPGPWCFVDDNIKTVEEIDIDGEGDRIVYIPYDSNDSGMICVARDTIPWLLEVAGCFQRGDADLLDELIEYIDFLIPSGMEAVGEGDEEFEMLLDDQKLLIRAKDHLFRMLAAAKIMEEKE